MSSDSDCLSGMAKPNERISELESIHTLRSGTKNPSLCLLKESRCFKILKCLEGITAIHTGSQSYSGSGNGNGPEAATMFAVCSSKYWDPLNSCFKNSSTHYIKRFG